MQTSKLTVLTLSIALLSGLFACKKTDIPHTEEAAPELVSKKVTPGFAENDMVLFWNEKAQSVITLNINPPSQSRFFAMVQLAVHDALNSIKPKYERYALVDAREPFAAVDAAVASAAYHTLNTLNLGSKPLLQEWYTQSLAQVPDGESELAGIELGKAASAAIIAKRSTDNYVQANVQQPGTDGTEPGQYRSTLPFSLPAFPDIKALHLWGALMTPFALESSSQFRPGAPYAVNTPEYTADYNEVKMKGGRVGHTRTPEEDQIARFWVERSAYGWNRLARQLILQHKMDAWKTARLLALAHMAMADAATASFEAKYYYFYWRPETAIRLGDVDGNPATVGDPAWLSMYTETPNLANPAANVNTPPLPDYPSLHAGYGGAAGEVLRLFFDTDQVSLDLTSTTLPNVTRHYSTISQAIRDNSLSRIYVGYHFRKAVDAGEQQGVQIGSYVFHNVLREEVE